MKYPKKKRYLSFQRTAKNIIKIEDKIFETSWEIRNVNTARFLKALDGRTDPYKIDPNFSRQEVDELIQFFEKYGLLDKGEHCKRLGIGSVLISLWCPKIRKIHYIFAKLWNKMLLFLWLPLFVVGGKILNSYRWNVVESEWGSVQGWFFFGIGIFLHELSHAAACLSYGG